MRTLGKFLKAAPGAWAMIPRDMVSTVLDAPAMPEEAMGRGSRDATARPPVIRLLCVEDNPDDVELMGIALERADPQRRYDLHRVDDATAFVEAVADDYDAILCDFNLPGSRRTPPSRSW